MATGTNHIQGLWADLLMPMNADLSVNTKKLYTHIQTLAAKGAAGLVLFGRCGEGWSFSANERASVVQQLIKLGVSGQDILLNAGTSNASDSVRLIQEGQSLGVKHFMLMPPVMGTDSTDQGLVDFFKQTLSHLTGLEMGIYLSSPISPNDQRDSRQTPQVFSRSDRSKPQCQSHLGLAPFFFKPVASIHRSRHECAGTCRYGHTHLCFSLRQHIDPNDGQICKTAG
jgi:hypothetical protein